MLSSIAGCRVLVVEDDYYLATDLAGELVRAGADVLGPVGNVRTALDALEQAPDAAVLDVQLGDEFSFPVADELALRGVPFVFATGAPSMVPESHKARPIYPKPVLSSVILTALAGVLGEVP